MIIQDDEVYIIKEVVDGIAYKEDMTNNPEMSILDGEYFIIVSDVK